MIYFNIALDNDHIQALPINVDLIKISILRSLPLYSSRKIRWFSISGQLFQLFCPSNQNDTEVHFSTPTQGGIDGVKDQLKLNYLATC
jgi:hypothetical protein